MDTDEPPPPPDVSATNAADHEAVSLSDSPSAFDPLLNPPPPSPFTLAADEDDVDGIDEEIVSPCPPAPAPASTPSYGFLSITVSDPLKENEPSGSATFVSYLISSRTALGGAACHVRRRFRDVVALADRLAVTHRGFFVPSRPDKGVVESQVMQKYEFVEQRRVALEKYLRRLAKHPVISISEDFETFLSAPSYSVSALARSTISNGEQEREVAAANVPKGKDLFGMFKDFRQTMANSFASARPPPVEEERDEDFLKRKEKLQEVEQQITNSSQKAEALVKSQQDLAETMGELGMTLIKLTKFETEETTCDPQRTLSTEMRNFATAVLKASRFQRGLNAQIVSHLDTLHEYFNLIIYAHNAFADRSDALTSVQALSADIYLLHIRAGRLEGDHSRQLKLEELKEAIRSTEEAKNCAIRNYERIKENNRNELQRLEKERRRDLVEMMKGFVTTQVAYSEKIANMWAAAAEETKQYQRRRPHSNGV